MEELALVTFLAETAKPVLADHSAVPADMTVWTLRPLLAARRVGEELAHGRRGLWNILPILNIN